MTEVPVLDQVVRLADVLRRAGVAVSTADVLDAGQALGVVDLSDRRVVRVALRSTMVRRETDLAAFERAFETIFGAHVVSEPVGPGAPERHGPPSLAPDGRQLSAELAATAAAGEVAAMGDLAARAVALFGDDESAERHVIHRILRALDVANVLSAAMRRLRAEGATELELALRRHEIAAALEAFRRALATEVARRRASGWSLDEAPELPPSSLDRPLGTLTALELADLRRAVAPLARQLAARVGRRRRAGLSGRVDVRRTVRNSLQTGGIPLDLVMKRTHPHRPDVVLLCDVSGSVAEFARFTFALVAAAHDVLARVRSFAFVGGVAEVTDVFRLATYDVPVQRLLERRGVVGLDGHSDYGEVFRQFASDHLDSVTSRTTVLVTGDARSNFRDPGTEAFAAICERARRVYWLDPEPRADWEVDDSMIGAYAAHCDGVFEVSTVRMLADVVGELV
jgi:uncharacterized protein with von Willebrand factor type A (vWA) domain